MSESTAKAQRRELRRIAGGAAVSAIDRQAEAIQELRAGGDRMVVSIRLSHDRHDKSEAAIVRIEDESKKRDGHFTEFVGRSFRDRFRWLVFGR